MQWKKVLVWGLLAFVVWLVMVVALMPASFALRLAGQAAPSLIVRHASGTIWNGSAASVQLNQLLLPNVQWQLSPWRLFTGTVQTDLQFGGDNTLQGQLRVVASTSAQRLENIDLTIPAQQLNALLPLPGAQLHGLFRFDGPRIAFEDKQLKALEGRLQWRDARVQTPLGQPPLGSYALQFRTDENGTIFGDISDLEGVLDLQGTMQYQAPNLSISATSRADLPEQLDRFFRAVAKREGNRYQISFQRQMQL
ncbi:type II secretion system protein N [Permianibacter aggregans]|uniref:Type II secretion system protein N n=1 Tax=Permianibacter aggregans TaxID=1510150 RepID=A0A4R6UUU8_9GAMM|nr:type II secretion system protein N [Permianibacter aggregans]QGX39561.1 type II secretion system protein N [Permianibacter aggregans]TDQ49689.1 type II secretion system protein N (GspN) [Permianibacter aggregans]